MREKFPTIAALIPELKAGEQPAWEKLCNRFRSGLISRTRYYFQTRQMIGALSPEDIVQETFLKAWKSRHSFRGETTSQFAKWILTILRNQTIDSIRQVPPEGPMATWFDYSGEELTPGAKLISLEHEAQLHSCIADMKPRQQKILILRHFEGLKFVEIAEQTGMNINTVAGIYRRGLARLIEAMQVYEVDSSV